MKAETISPKHIMAMLELQQYRCAYTGDELTPDNVSADHMQPIGGGGAHAMENIRLVLDVVNQAKGTMSYEDFVAMCRKVVNHHDNRTGAA
jgi:hypothetical protein